MQLLDMLKGVMGKVPGCPEGEAAAQMLNACMEFCERTYWLTEPVTITTSATPGATVSLDAQVLDIIEAKVGDDDLFITYVNDPRIDQLAPGKYALTFADPSYPLITPTPPVGTVVSLLIVSAPGPSAEGVADVLWLRHSEALTHGALARLLAEPKKAWSDPQTASYHHGRFEAAMQRAASDASRNRKTTGRRLRVARV
jgi:hypothetical protein